jgi:hypothetical protein
VAASLIQTVRADRAPAPSLGLVRTRFDSSSSRVKSIKGLQGSLSCMPECFRGTEAPNHMCRAVVRCLCFASKLEVNIVVALADDSPLFVFRREPAE